MRTANDLTRNEWWKLKTIILEKTGYCFHGHYLIRQALTRSSYSAEHGGESNEILEFFGDQILSYYVVKMIADRCGAMNHNAEYAFRIRENHFTEIKQALVNNKALADRIDGWGITEFLIVGRSDYNNDVAKQTKVKADLFEAILGAIAVACKWDPAVLEKAVGQMLCIDEQIESLIKTDDRPVQFDPDTAVTVLKELGEHGECSIPEYHFASLGHDNDGNPMWCCTCSIVNEETGISKQVWAPSKKTAKKYAAYLALCQHYQLQNEYGTNNCHIWQYRDGTLIPTHKFL